MLNLMVEYDYYLVIYELFGFQKPFSKDLNDNIIIRIKMNQFKRCQIGSEVFDFSISNYQYNM